MKMFSIRLLSGIVILLTAVLGAAETPAPAKWSEDYLQARKEAAAVKKPILLFFTGSDWCPPCMRLEKTVFSQKAFDRFAATGKVILFKADYPRSRRQDPRISAQNRQLLQVYNIQGYPTVILADDSGREFARTGFRTGGAEKYIRHLEELLNKAPKK